MQRFFGVTQDASGNAIPAVSVTVRLAGTGTLGTLYSADSIFSPLTNPFTSNADGTYQFYAQNAHYDVTLFKTGFTFTAAETADAILYDAASSTTASFAGNQNDYSPGGGPESSIWLLDNNTATTTLTGLLAPQSSTGIRKITLINNNASANLNLAFNSGLSSANNRFAIANGRDYVLFPTESVDLRYYNSKWTIGAWQDARAIDKVTTPTTISNSAAETTIYTKTISGGLLGVKSVLALTLTGRNTSNTGIAQSTQIRLKYGGTVFSTALHSTFDTSTNELWMIRCRVEGFNATNAQLGTTESTRYLSSSSAGNAMGTRGTSAIDSTADQTLAVTWQFNTNSNNLTYTMDHALLEWWP